MKKIIPFDKEYQFWFLEDRSLEFMHPISDYFLKINDLSINILISLKWIRWGFFFFKSISEELKSDFNDYNVNTMISNALESPFEDLVEKSHILLIDNYEIKTENELDELINNFYNNKIFDENTKIHFKLKLNLREYLLISNVLFPTLIK